MLGDGAQQVSWLPNWPAKIMRIWKMHTLCCYCCGSVFSDGDALFASSPSLLDAGKPLSLTFQRTGNK